jgi:hypothetical protein
MERFVKKEGKKESQKRPPVTLDRRNREGEPSAKV